MTVKRYGSVLFDTGLIEMACGDYVTYSDYQKLAAENAALREQSEDVYAAGYNHGHLNTVDGIAYAPGIKDDFYSLALQIMAELETPDTDAFTAELRAQGVDELANQLDGLPFTCGVNHQYVVSFAANLRAGRKG